MEVLTFVHEGLGNSSYLLGLGDGRAAAVDPDRNIARYLQAAEARGWSIESVFETHVHADFVSGANEMRAHSGATLYMPAGSGSRLPHNALGAGARVTVDGVELETIASPGHTPEHASYVVRSGSSPPLLFSGGSLMVGGAARTDLIAPEETERLTRAQYRTLMQAFTGLPDETPLFPTHGAGSFCSAGGSGERSSTLGAERASNPVLSLPSEEEFVRWFPTTFPGAPAYYFRMRAFNQAGPRLRRDIAMPRPLAPDEFAASADGGALIVDTRTVEEYSRAHIAGSLHNAIRPAFGVWLGWVVPAGARLLFVAEPEHVDEIIDECLLVGYESFAGWLAGGIDAWEASGRPTASTELLSPEKARDLVASGAHVLDVREPDEYARGHVPLASHIPLGDLPGRQPFAANDEPIVVYCGHGERASTAASLLERQGYRALANVRGGYPELREVQL